MYKYIIFFILFILFIVWFYYALRMKNVYKFHLYTGKKGSGKSTVETAMALYYATHSVLIYDYEQPRFHRFVKKKFKIYSNSPVKGIETEYFNPLDLGISFFPEPYSILLIDEISLFWWNRNFKSMDERTVEWFRNQRKYRVICFGFTQSWDIDKVLRKSLVDYVYLCKSFLVTWCIVRKVDKYQDIKESALDGDSQFSESMRFVPIWIPHAIRFIWIPKYFKYYDTNYIFSKQKRD